MSFDTEPGTRSNPGSAWMDPAGADGARPELLFIARDDPSLIGPWASPNAPVPTGLDAEPVSEPVPLSPLVAKVAGEAAVSESAETTNPFGILPPDIIIPEIKLDQSEQSAAAEAKRVAATRINTTLEVMLHWVYDEGVLSKEELQVVPPPVELGKLNSEERAIVIAAAGVLTGRPLPLPSRGLIARQLRLGPNAANLVVAAHAIVDPPAPPRGRIQAIRYTAAVRAQRADPEIGMLSRAADSAIFRAYKTHAAGGPARMLLLAMAAHQIGRDKDADPTLETAVAESFRTMYEATRGQLGELKGLTQEVLTPLQVLRQQVMEARKQLVHARLTSSEYATILQGAVQTYTKMVDTQEAGAREKKHAEQVWEANYARLPKHEKEQGEYHNALVVMPSRRLAQMVAYQYKQLTQVDERIAKLHEDTAKAIAAGLTQSQYEATLEGLLHDKDVYSRAVAGAGMALFEQSFGARVEDEAAIRLAVNETRSPRLARELAKIEAAKLYDRLALKVILPVAVQSAASRGDAIAAGYITAADALLATMVDPNAFGVSDGRIISIPPEIRRPLLVLQGFPSNERPKRGAFIQGVFLRNRYHQRTRGTQHGTVSSTPPQPAARLYESWAGVQEVMRLTYVDKLLEHGVGKIPEEMQLRRQAWAADVADRTKLGTNKYGITRGTQLRLESSYGAQQDLRQYNQQTERLLKPYVERVAAGRR